MEHIVQFAIGIDDDAIVKKVSEHAEKEIIKNLEQQVANKIFQAYYYSQNADPKHDKLSSFSERIVLNFLEENKEALTIQEITSNSEVAKVAIVGAGMMSNPGVASQMFEALFNSGININMISTSEIRITVLIDEKDVDRATRAIHEKFALGEV